MIDLRDHGGLFGAGKYRKGTIVDFNNLAFPTAYPVKRLFYNYYGNTLGILRIVDNFLYVIGSASGNTLYLNKYSISDDGNGSLQCSLILSKNYANGYYPKSLLYFPGNSNLLFGAGSTIYYLDPNTLSTGSTFASVQYEIVDMYWLSNGNLCVITVNGSTSIYIKVYNPSGTLISTYIYTGTYFPLILPDGNIAYSDNGYKTYIYNPITNTASALMFTANVQSLIHSNYQSYGYNVTSYGLVFGNVMVTAYQSYIRFYSYSNGQLSYISSILINSGAHYPNIRKINDNTIHVITPNYECLIDVNTKTISQPTKPISDLSIVNDVTAFLDLEYPTADKTFLYMTSNFNGFTCPVFKTKIIN